jgi:hypothetical protein
MGFSASGPASVVLRWCGRRVGSLGPGLTSESADAFSGCPANDSSARSQVFLAPIGGAVPICPSCARGRGSSPAASGCVPSFNHEAQGRSAPRRCRHRGRARRAGHDGQLSRPRESGASCRAYDDGRPGPSAAGRLHAVSPAPRSGNAARPASSSRWVITSRSATPASRRSVRLSVRRRRRGCERRVGLSAVGNSYGGRLAMYSLTIYNVTMTIRRSGKRYSCLVPRITA